mmetsp:Transcript_7884/g.19527  ORF Transcript_7884/g.19527 Transcript_7884/m.19527 type:complete len:272 (-) Transcript_7884:35-850(-)
MLVAGEEEVQKHEIQEENEIHEMPIRERDGHRHELRNFPVGLHRLAQALVQTVVNVGGFLPPRSVHAVLLQSVPDDVHRPHGQDRYDLLPRVLPQHAGLLFGEQAFFYDLLPLVIGEVVARDAHEEEVRRRQEVFRRLQPVIPKLLCFQGDRKLVDEEHDALQHVHAGGVQLLIATVAVAVVEREEEGREVLHRAGRFPVNLEPVTLRLRPGEGHQESVSDEEEPEFAAPEDTLHGGVPELREGRRSCRLRLVVPRHLLYPRIAKVGAGGC